MSIELKQHASEGDGGDNRKTIVETPYKYMNTLEMKSTFL